MKRVVSTLRWVSVCGLLAQGCGDDEGGGQSCTVDADCNVGFLCKQEICTAANQGDERQFGQTTMDFTSGSEIYLLAVYALPTADAAPDAPVVFTLDPGAGTGGALRFEETRTQPVANLTTPANRFAQWRHSQSQAIAELYRNNPPQARAVRSPPCNPDCNTSSICWQGSCVTTVDLLFADNSTTVNTTLAGVVNAGGTLINVLVDNNDSGSATACVNATTAFAGSFATELSVLGLSGHTGTIDRDEDGRMTLVFTSQTVPGNSNLGLDNVGFFNPNDFLNTGTGNATGNESDLLWVRVPGTSNTGGTITEDLAVGTIAHEYQHLASFASRVQAQGQSAVAESLWLDEGMSHVVEDLTGWQASNIGNAAQALFDWDLSPFAASTDTNGQRGMAYMLLRHVIDQQAKSAGASDAASSQVITAAGSFLGGLLTETSKSGFTHTAIAGLGSEGIWKWIKAAYVTNNSLVLAAAKTDTYLPLSNAGGIERGFDPFHTYTDARGTSVPLDGPATGDIFDLSVPFTDGEVLEGGSVLYLASGVGTGSFTVTGVGDAFVDLHIRSVRVE